MSKTVTAKNGDSLCSFATAVGFINCDPLRAEPANSAFLNRPLVDGDIVTIPDVRAKEGAKFTNQRHKFIAKNTPVSIHFVRSTPSKDYRHDIRLNGLNVSKFVTNKAGDDGRSGFPSGNSYDVNGDADVDAFQLEVVDPGAPTYVYATLEALKPVKQADGSTQFQPITGVPNSALRKIDQILCDKLPAAGAFRSDYMRLVVDERDQAALPNNTLLIAETVDAGDETLEILDQHVKATYTISRCNGTPKCTATEELPIGQEKKRVRVAVHILRDPTTNQPLVTVDQARRSILKSVRQLYAQANMSVKIVDIRNIQAPTNLIAIANPEQGTAKGSSSAKGNGTIKIRVQIGQLHQAKFDFDRTVQVVTKAYDLPTDTATALANALDSAFQAAKPPFPAVARASNNRQRIGNQVGSADVLVGDPWTQSITLSVIESSEPAQPVKIGRITSTHIPEYDRDTSPVGTIEERTLVKNYAAGTDHVNLFVIGTLGRETYGEAFMPGKFRDVSEQPFPPMANSALIVADVFTKEEYHYTTVPHEMGHILMDAFHERISTEMMYGLAGSGDDRAVDGPKRISDATMPFDGGHSDSNPVKLLRTANQAMLELW